MGDLHFEGAVSALTEQILEHACLTVQDLYVMDCQWVYIGNWDSLVMQVSSDLTTFEILLPHLP